MGKINIDNIEYDTDSFSDEAKNALGALQFTEMEIQRLQAKIAAMQTARMAYANGLKQALKNTTYNEPGTPFEVSPGATLKF